MSNAVPMTAELRRILALPRRDPIPPTDAARLLTQMLKTPHGTQELFPIQAWAILEAVDGQGLIGFMPVGSGKTIPTHVIPVAAEAKRPVLFVPAALRDKALAEDIPELRQHWRMHCNLRIFSYEMLSNPKSVQLLEEICPDWILLDEAQNLKNPQAMRTKRFLLYLKRHPATRLVALSGTPTNKSLFDFAHLVQNALKGERCPIPQSYVVLDDWDAALGANQNWATRPPKEPGALGLLCPGEEPTIENVRRGFYRRLFETHGVIATTENAVEGVKLKIRRRHLQVPERIEGALKTLRTTWKTAWGEEVESGLAMMRHARQLASGFYLRWKWPNNQPDKEWLFARAEWHKEVREWLKRPQFGTLGPANIANMIIEGKLHSDCYAPWALIADRYGRKGPPVEAVWLDTFLAQDVVRWLSEHPNGIAWYNHRAIGSVLKHFGVAVYGSEEGHAIKQARGPIAACIRAHGTGKNLQHHHWQNLVTDCPPDGAVWEQLTARTHRRGQKQPVVTFDVLLHTQELEHSWAQAIYRARYLHAGTPQKLFATAEWEDMPIVI